ncbi:MAG TPA: hypothetical protein PKN92_08670, partial [Candidatus Hydrogenedentes bacterium]|nr:hypothetical protein [Candidatus Hydrogenedentota bacterium]
MQDAAEPAVSIHFLAPLVYVCIFSFQHRYDGVAGFAFADLINGDDIVFLFFASQMIVDVSLPYPCTSQHRFEDFRDGGFVFGNSGIKGRLKIRPYPG